MNSYATTIEQFTLWLRAYQTAWEGRDAAAAARLFTDDARYYWTPLVPPQQGPAEIAAAWDAAVSNHPDQFKVRIEGVFSAEFAAVGQCRLFREWWHSSESPA